MPNGDYSLSKEDWERIRAFFEAHSDVLLGFASKHNLVIDKYYHESPSWTFRFQHPKGGGAGIHLEHVNDSTIRIGKSWYIDDFENFTRFLKSESGREMPLASIKLGETLEVSLTEMTNWNKDEMTAYGGYEKFWSQYTKEQWREMSPEERLPIAKL
jgi:hypothetical protein